MVRCVSCAIEALARARLADPEPALAEIAAAKATYQGPLGGQIQVAARLLGLAEADLWDLHDGLSPYERSRRAPPSAWFHLGRLVRATGELEESLPGSSLSHGLLRALVSEGKPALLLGQAA